MDRERKEVGKIVRNMMNNPVVIW